MTSRHVSSGKKNEIIDSDGAEVIVVFKHGLSDKHLTRCFGKYKPKTMLTLMEIVTKFCSGEDEWYAKQKAHDGGSRHVRYEGRGRQT